MASQPDPRIAKSLGRFAAFCSVLSVGFGLVVLTGWVFHIQRLKTILSGQVTVKANAAVCFVLIGLALWLVRREDQNRPWGWRLAAHVLALLVIVVGLLSFLEYWYGWNPGLDQLLFAVGPEDVAGGVRGALMAPLAAIDFCLLGAAVVLLDLRSHWSRRLAQVLASIVAVVSIFGILDFVLAPNATHTHIAPTTALVLFLFSFGAMFSRCEWGVGALLASTSPGGELGRRLLPAAIAVPIVIAWLRWKGQMAGLYSEWTGLALMTAAVVVLLAGASAWTVFATDRIDAERRRAEESVRRLASILTSSTDAIVATTLEGIVTSWNPGAETTYGYSAQEMVGHSIGVTIPADRLDEFQTLLQKVARGERVSYLETMRIHKDGQPFHVSLSVSPVKNETGEIVGASTIARDITERKRAEEKLLAANNELEAFTYSVSHDLRAPLRHISGFSKILTEEFGPTLPVDAQHHLQRIEEGTLRMGMLVDDLLNLARVGRRDLSSQVTGLSSVVDEVLAELKPETEGRKIEWKIGNLPYVECDPGLMKQVFQNLLSNALKFTRLRSQAVIEVGQQEKDGASAVYVRDNGVGFSMKYANKLFGVFQRLHRSEDFEGTGAGLAIVQRILQKHGGRIWAEAELDKGATFYFTLGNSQNPELRVKAVIVGEKA